MEELRRGVADLTRRKQKLADKLAGLERSMKGAPRGRCAAAQLGPAQLFLAQALGGWGAASTLWLEVERRVGGQAAAPHGACLQCSAS